ncbi:hypothetical protein [Bradyrhizobium elkanii]|uniref:hypothetical protein n=1 Tax=Bradyrhizobium elkanii TaxID=29448 RepID=UPI0021686448|nr:hypothetical protein [Bradyrhizobium elkanii]MCS3517081.1 hypothetical protein [Bradyrhizobium elkanii]MCS4073638.1 hypothetical protein [Bradyrhizobium elkanii]MCS4080271.1 hypothetical protein [Bradyrhizobium elkanii]MDH6691864.1 hypothetical protein [Bradyrhizobium elkanii]
MTEQMELDASFNLLRHLLKEPSALPAKTFEAAKSLAQDIGDRYYFNSGWRAANQDRELKGTAATAKILEEIKPLVDLLRHKQKPKRAKGRPAMEDVHPDYLNCVVVVSLGKPSQKRDLIRLCLEEGWLKDREEVKDGTRTTTTFEAHVKQVDRELAKLAKRRAARPPKNVLIFRPRKPGRR